MTDKVRYPWEIAYSFAVSIVHALAPYCVRIEIAGSLRRHKPDVGDIEILYIPAIGEDRDFESLFADPEANLADRKIQDLEHDGILERRPNSLGRTTYGPKIKLMRLLSGMPVDLFASTEEGWWSYLVCRTGPADLNIKICNEAQRRGFKWEPYEGFIRVGTGLPLNEEHFRCKSERDVFNFVGIPCVDPWERDRLISPEMSTFRGSA